jgi:hypothetical protein
VTSGNYAQWENIGKEDSMGVYEKISILQRKIRKGRDQRNVPTGKDRLLSSACASNTYFNHYAPPD